MATHNECIVMVLKLSDATVSGVRRHQLCQSELIRRWRVPLEESRGDERLKHEQTTEIDTVYSIDSPSPSSIQRWCPGVRLSVIIVWIIWILHPCIIQRSISYQSTALEAAVNRRTKPSK